MAKDKDAEIMQARAAFYQKNKSGYLRRPRSSRPSVGLTELKSRLVDGTSIADTRPVTVNAFLPSIDQRVAMYERAGMARKVARQRMAIDALELTDEQRSAMYEQLHNDEDWGDDFDDLPEEGLSDYELSQSTLRREASIARNARKKASEEKKAKAATPPAEEPAKAPKGTVASDDAPADAGKTK